MGGRNFMLGGFYMLASKTAGFRWIRGGGNLDIPPLLGSPSSNLLSNRRMIKLSKNTAARLNLQLFLDSIGNDLLGGH